MEISQIRTLLHVAELGSLRSAADRLSIAQPALSRQVRQLERELGAPLFVRHGRGMVPTDLCRRILQPASGIMTSLDAIRGEALRERGHLAGRVRVGLTPTIADMVTVPLAQAVRHTAPEIELSLSSAYSGFLLEWLKRDVLDCCISYDPEETDTVRCDPVLSEPLMLISRSDDGATAGPPIPFRSLLGRPLVLPSPLHGLRRIIDRCATAAGVRLEAAIEADTLGGMIDLVRAGFGSTILPKGALGDRAARGDYVVAPLVDPEPRRRIVVVYPRDRPVSATARFVGTAFATLSATLIESGAWEASRLTR